MMLKLNYSIKYKIIVLLVTLPCFGIGTYFYSVRNLFKADKKTYIYDAIFTYNKSLQKQVGSLLKNQENLIDFISFNWDVVDRKLSNNIIGLIKKNKNIDILNIYTSKRNKLHKKLHINKKKDYIETFLSGNFSSIKPILNTNYRSISKKIIFLYKNIPDKNIIIEIGLNTKSINNIINSDGIFINSLFNRDGLKIFPIKEELNESNIRSHIKNNSISPGVFELNDNLIAYGLLGDFVFSSSITKEKAYLTMELLDKKSILFIILIVSLGIVVSIITGKILTENIEKLNTAAEQFMQGDFDVLIDIKSKDEIGKFAKTFMTMALKIKGLLSDLEEYNRLLEKKVQERTMQLKEAMDLQKTILDTVDQGFVLIDNKQKISDIYSKKAEQIFGGKPDELSFSQLLHVDDSESDSYKDFFEMSISEEMPFEDIIIGAPNKFINSNGRSIFLEYHQAVNDNKKIVIVATDETELIQSEQKAKTQQSQVSIVLNYLNNKDSFNRFIQYLNESAKSLITIVNKNIKTDLVYTLRLVHTIKGNSLFYSFDKVANYAHELETLLTSVEEVTIDLKEKINELAQVIKAQVSEVLTLINDDDKGTEAYISEFNLNRIMNLSDTPLELQEYIRYLKVSVPGSKIFSYISSIINKTSKSLNKDISIDFNGENERVPRKLLNSLEPIFVHLINNCIDHGIKHKGILNFEIEHKDYLMITIKDDGNGIDIEKLKKKALSNKMDTSHLSNNEIIQLIFKDGYSTKDDINFISGRGVGMAEVKSKIELIGGEILVSTETGKGTCFELHFK